MKKIQKLLNIFKKPLNRESFDAYETLHSNLKPLQQWESPFADRQKILIYDIENCLKFSKLKKNAYISEIYKYFQKPCKIKVLKLTIQI